MALNLPIIETIAEAIFSTLQSITVQNNYNFDLVAERLQMTGANPAHLKIVLYQLDPDHAENQPIGKDSWVQPFGIDCYVIPSSTDTISCDTYKNCIYGDIYKALMADYTIGGLAQISEILPPVHFKSKNGDFEGFAFQFDVNYRTAKDDPFTQG